MKDLSASLKQISNITEKNIDITDEAGNIIYSSDSARIGCKVEAFKKINHIRNSPAFGLYIHMAGSTTEEIGLARLILKDTMSEAAAGNYQQLLINLMDGCKYNEDLCSRFNIPFNKDYTVYCVSGIVDESFNDVQALMLNGFYENKQFWVFPYNNDILLLELADSLHTDAGQTSNIIRDMINTEIYIDVCIGVGNRHTGLLNIRKSYSEAREAIRIGKEIHYPHGIYIYRDLLTERVISKLTGENLEEFMSDMLSRNIDKIIDEEIIKTIQAMFKNNLNISDSSRALYIHRNTLLYRIEKIQKITGIDIRKFEDAVILKLYLVMKERK